MAMTSRSASLVLTVGDGMLFFSPGASSVPDGVSGAVESGVDAGTASKIMALFLSEDGVLNDDDDDDEWGGWAGVGVVGAGSSNSVKGWAGVGAGA